MVTSKQEKIMVITHCYSSVDIHQEEKDVFKVVCRVEYLVTCRGTSTNPLDKNSENDNEKDKKQNIVRWFNFRIKSESKKMNLLYSLLFLFVGSLLAVFLWRNKHHTSYTSNIFIQFRYMMLLTWIPVTPVVMRGHFHNCNA